MYNAEKREVIEAINDIRKSMRLQPLDYNYLYEMEYEELKNMYKRQVEFKKAFERPVEMPVRNVAGKKEIGERIKMNLKSILMIVVPVAAIVIGFIFYMFYSKYFYIWTAKAPATFAECIDITDSALSEGNTCAADSDCMFTSFCKCANDVTYSRVENLINSGDCVKYKQTDCPSIRCACENSECVVVETG